MEPVWMTPESKVRIPLAVDLETGIPEAKTQSSEVQDFSEPGLKDVESSKLQKSAEGAIERARLGKEQRDGGTIWEYGYDMAHLHNIDAPGCLDEQRLALDTQRVALEAKFAEKRARDLGWSEKRSQHTFCVISLAGEFRIAFPKPSVHVVLLPL
ncbi:hypothetical protein B0H14DRAFT_2628862 [Mycena olivaceomarginata]|nr:hypothetical protein B0H14DRAFT_2628862 [Mycena olivaceomarginata]